MKKIYIENFKGISSLEIDFTSTNNVLYAENGAGKTSIAEAIRMMAFSSNIERNRIKANIVGEERIAAQRDWLNSYLHNPSSTSFKIKIDETDFSFPNTTEIDNVLILSRSQLKPTSEILLSDIINEINFKCSYQIDELISKDIIEMVLDEVNKILEKDFKENIKIILPEGDKKNIGIKGICEDYIAYEIDSKVNEANQNLIKILIFICYLKVLPKLDSDNNYLVVFDDIISSLDLANRIVMAKILVEIGNEYQLLILTHNVGFYNLMNHIVNIMKVEQNWAFKTMYKKDELHIVYTSKNEDVDLLLEKYGGHILPSDTEAVNSMRKLFENLLHEFSKILILGTQEETKDIIGKISTKETGYYCHIEGQKICNHVDLINRIAHLLDVCPSEQLKSKIKETINKFNTQNEFPWIRDVINSLHTYQKVILHQGSHSQSGLYVISTKEIAITIELMKKIENIIKRNSTNFPYFI